MATTRKKTMNDTNEVSAMQSAALTGDSVPGRVLLAPWGRVESTNGSFIVDEESARLVVEAFDAHGTDLPIDYEHQTLGGEYSSPTGQAPAAGWIKRLVAEPGVGVLAEIEWTEQGRAMLAAKEYRYLSPVAVIRKSDRKLMGIHSAALTNKPAIVGMEPIVSHARAAADEESAEPMARLRSELNLTEEATPEVVLVAASRRLADLQRDAKQLYVEQRIAEAMRTGKLVEAQRAWAESLVAREQGLFEEWFRTAPPVVQPGVIRPPSGLDGMSRRTEPIAARARAEFRTNRILSGLTTEDAYVADALRSGGC